MKARRIEAGVATARRGAGALVMVVAPLVGVLALTAGCTATSTPPTRRPAHHRKSGVGGGDRAHRPSGSVGNSAPGSARLPSRLPARQPSRRSGRTVTVRIPGTRSGFVGRPALVYVPPAAHRGAALPLLELLHGTPGAPTDWVQRGGLERTAAAFADRHAGRAPIVVMPDINGNERGDSECIRTPGGADVERYLGRELPRYMAAHFPVATDHRRWAIAGISEGGTCAAMLALRHPAVFASFGDMSGLARPTVGDTDDPPRTVKVLFGGSRAAYDRHDPQWLMRHRRYPATSAWFVCGAQESVVAQDQTRVARLARAAGMTVKTSVVPGRHDWSTWRIAFRRYLPWLWRQLRP